MKKRNPAAKSLRVLGKRIVEAKKGKGAYTRKGKRNTLPKD